MSRRNKTNEKKVGKLESTLKNLNLKEKILLLITSLIVIFIILNFAIMQPIKDRTVDLNGEIVGLKIKSLDASTSNKINNKLINEYTKAKDQYNRLIEEFNNTTQYNLVEEILSFAKSTGVEAKNISFTKGTQNKQYKDITKNTGVIDVKGQYNNIVSFLNLLEENKKDVIIDGVNIYDNNMGNVSNGDSFIGDIKISYFNTQKDLNKNG